MKRGRTPGIGERFGRLVVLEETTSKPPGKLRRRSARCLCDCGAETTVLLQHLFRPNGQISCGCAKRKGTMTTAFRSTRDTPRRRPIKHGLAGHPSYYRWFNMVDRCDNPNHRAYKNYGERGITVAAEWRAPAVFLAYVDAFLGPCPPGHSLDRIDNDGNYEPGNIRWASRSEQVRNSRRRSKSSSLS